MTRRGRRRRSGRRLRRTELNRCICGGNGGHAPCNLVTQSSRLTAAASARTHHRTQNDTLSPG